VNQAADNLSEINRHPRLRDQIGGCFVKPARCGNEPVQPIERVFDKTNRPLGGLIIFGNRASQRLEGLADDRDRGLEGVSIFFRRTPDLGGRAMQGVDHAVELGAYIGQLGEASLA
jgi:hypothetical protein